MKRILLIIATNLAALCVALLLAEGIVRLTWTPPSTLTTNSTEYHPVYEWAPIPNLHGRNVTAEFDYQFEHTAQGLRGNTIFSPQRPPGISRRILFLGDSFTYGIGSGNDAGFVERIHNGIPGTQAVNTGANGYGQRQELAILSTLGVALKPDLTVVMFFWNDLEDNLDRNSAAFALAPDGRVVRTDKAIPGDFDPLALRPGGAPATAPRNGAYRPWRKTWLFKLFKEGTKGFRRRWFGARPRMIQTRAQADAAWAETETLLGLMNVQAAQIGSELLVVSIPDAERVDPAMKLKGQLQLNVEIEERLSAVCARLGIPYVSLLPGLVEWRQRDPRPLYFIADRHLTPEGNAAVASLLTDILGPTPQ